MENRKSAEEILSTLRQAVLPDPEAHARDKVEREMNLAFAEAMLATGADLGSQMTYQEVRQIAQHIRSDETLLTRFPATANLSKKPRNEKANQRVIDLREEAESDVFVFLNASAVRQAVLGRLRPETTATKSPAKPPVFKSRRADTL